MWHAYVLFTLREVVTVWPHDRNRKFKASAKRKPELNKRLCWPRQNRMNKASEGKKNSPIYTPAVASWWRPVNYCQINQENYDNENN